MQRGTNKASCLSVPGADKATSPPALPAHPKLTLEVCMVPRKCPQDWRCSCDCWDDSKSYKHGRRAFAVSTASDIKGKSYSEKLQPFKLGLVLSVPWPTATFRISPCLTSRDTAPLWSLENTVFSLWIGKAACLRSTCLISRRAGDATNEESQAAWHSPSPAAMARLCEAYTAGPVPHMAAIFLWRASSNHGQG